MELKSDHFNGYMNTELRDIPTQAILEMVTELSLNAIFVMSTEIEASVAARIATTAVDVMKNNRFKFMPLHLVCEGFTRGAMGELGGTTRFTVRNIFTWMSAMYEKLALINIEKKTKEDAVRRTEESRSFKRQQKINNLYGAATYWKISHCPMSDAEYDRLTLDKIVARMKDGFSIETLTPEMIL